MGRRGRPPHPDVLTPREWEVLALIREGLSNEEIAERLGITYRTARYHVSEILGKLGLSTRQEAAGWQPSERPWRLAAFGFPFFLLKKAGSALPAAGSGAVVAASAGAFAVLIAGLALVGVMLVRAGGDDSFTMQMEGRAMEPTILQLATLTVRPYRGAALSRGDIVVVGMPDDRRLVKRIVGLPDETIEVRDGNVLIDGNALDEPYVVEPVQYQYGPEAVPPGHYFVLGDNRNNSSDSHSFGAVAAESIVGRVVAVEPPDESAAAPTLTVDQALSRSRSALFDGEDVLHITVTPDDSYLVLDYAEAWTDRREDSVRVRRHSEYLKGDPGAEPIELLFPGGRWTSGLADGSDGGDQLGRLIPLEQFQDLPPAVQDQVSIRREEGERSWIVLQRSYPGTTEFEASCPHDVRIYLDAASYLPAIIEEEDYACAASPQTTAARHVANLSYETTGRGEIDAGFFDAATLRATTLEQRLSAARAADTRTYWLGSQGLSEMQLGLDDHAGGSRLVYGPYDRFDILLDEYPAPEVSGAPCPLREGPGGVVTGEIATEPTQTSFGAGEYCPSDGWLRVEADGTLIYIWPGQERESPEQLIALADRLQPIE